MERVLELNEVYKGLRVLQLVGDEILLCECIYCKKQSAIREQNIDHLKPCICRQAAALEGTKVGSLTIIKAVSKGMGISCICECSFCKKVTERTQTQLSKTKSCGCQRNAGIDITGKVFGKLTVLGKAGVRNTNKQIQWICQCGCAEQNLVLRTKGSLKIKGTYPSCGCVRKAAIKAASKLCKKEGIPMSKALKRLKKVRT